MDYCGASYNPTETIQQEQIYQGNLITPNLDHMQQSDQQKHNVQKPNEKKLVAQQNGTCKLELSKSKTMMLNIFHGNMYAHLWDNKNKKNVTLNMDELYNLMSNKVQLEDTMNLMWLKPQR